MKQTNHRMTPAERHALHIRRAARKAWNTLPTLALYSLAAFGFFALCLFILETI